MSSTTKKTPIDENSKEYSENLPNTDELQREYDAFIRSQREENDRKKDKIAREIQAMGDQYVQEIDEKHNLKEEERLDMVDYIIQKTEQRLVNARELHNMTYEEVKSIYVKAQDEGKSWWRKFLEFMMGW